jgi:acyl-CoA synthetase (AMP-forming)/AMP-acid ligase II
MSSDPSSADTLPQLIQQAAACYGNKIAISDGDYQLSYQQLDTSRIAAARAFLAAGLNKGDRIAIWAPNIPLWIMAAIGAQSVGAVLVPLNTRLKGPEAGYILRTSGAKLLFTVSDFLDVSYPELLKSEELPDLEQIIMLSGASDGALPWEAFLEAGSAVDNVKLEAAIAEVMPSDTLDVLFTSGTTGKPKGVVTSHGQNIRVFANWSATVGLRSDDIYLIINPFFHSFGYKAGWLAAFIR